MEKKNEAYKTIGEVAKIVGLINTKNGKLSTHTIRYWEKEFKQLKPKIFSGRRRYYGDKEIRMIKLIKHLLKDKGFTIKGVKLSLSKSSNLSLDENRDYVVGTHSHNKGKIREKIKKISKIIEELKKLKNG